MLIVVSGINGCVSIAAFISLVGIPIGIGSSAVGLNICAITSRTKKYSVNNHEKEKKNHDKILYLEITKLNNIEISIFKAMIKSDISHDSFI